MGIDLLKYKLALQFKRLLSSSILISSNRVLLTDCQLNLGKTSLHHRVKYSEDLWHLRSSMLKLRKEKTLKLVG